MVSPYRFGIEVEGPYKDHVTLIAPGVKLHTPEAIGDVLERIRERRPNGPFATHIWAEVLEGEQFDWALITGMLMRDFRVTLQVRYPQDLPPSALRRHAHLAVVWMVPDEFRPLLETADYIKHATAPGYGFEARLRRNIFNPADYEQDEIWTAQ